MLLSTHRRLGEPTVVACGPTPTESGLQVGLLFVAADLTSSKVTLANDEERTTVSIPNEYLNLPAPQWFTGVTLEVIT